MAAAWISAPLIATPLLPVRSADPAIRPGRWSAVALMHWLMARSRGQLGASLEGGQMIGPSRHPASRLGRVPGTSITGPGLDSGRPLRLAPAAPRCFSKPSNSVISAGIQNVSCGGSPSSSLVTLISSAPKGFPWATAVSVNFGDGHQCDCATPTTWVGHRARQPVGSCVTRIAASRPSTSLAISPRLTTFQP